MSSCPVTGFLGEETDSHLATTSFQVLVDSDKASLEIPFLQAKQHQLDQLLLILLQLNQLSGLAHFMTLMNGGTTEIQQKEEEIIMFIFSASTFN